MPVSVCLWRLCIVVTGCNGSRISLHAWIDGCLCYLLRVWTRNTFDHLRATRWTPPDYWQTDNSSGLVMVIRNCHWLNSASRVLISTCYALLVQTGERKQTHKWMDGHYQTYYIQCNTIFTVWPWPLTYDLDLQSKASQGQGRSSCQKSRLKVKRFKQENAHRQTDGHTHGRYQTYYLPWYVVDKIIFCTYFGKCQRLC